MTYYEVCKAEVIITIAKCVFGATDDETNLDPTYKAKIAQAIKFVEENVPLMKALEQFR